MHYVIIGAGPAGVIAAESLRKGDSASRITLVGDEPEPPYSRMAIPYYLIDKIGERGMHLRKTDGYFAAQQIDLVRDCAQSIDATGGMINLEKGGSMAFDRLLIATGSVPVSPPIAGLGLAGVHHCWTMADARHIASLAKLSSKVVLMGAGFIGCIILEALAARGVDLTVVEMDDRMVPRMMDASSGSLIKRWCESKGVMVLTSARVSGVEAGSGHALAVALENGRVLPADLLICATGVRPNIAFLENSGIDTELGIVVDQRLQTSAAIIFAAGDVAQGRDFSTGSDSVQAIQPTAVEHGRIAAANMIDGSELIHAGLYQHECTRYHGPGFQVPLACGRVLTAAMPVRSAMTHVFATSICNSRTMCWWVANSLGLTQHVGVLRGMIQSRLPLGGWKRKLMDDPTRIMEAYLASTQGVGLTSKVG